MISEQIRRLAEIQATDDAFLSLYMDTQRNDESQRDRIRLFLKDELRKVREAFSGNGHGAEIEKGVRAIERYFEESVEPSTRGVAIFSCPARDLFIPLQLPVPVQPALAIGNRPHLRPLTLIREAYPPVMLAMVDAKSARLFELEFGQVLHEIDLEHPDMPRKHDQGGWSQANMQRHVQDHIDRHHKDVAEKLTRIVDRGARYQGVILSGQERNLGNFREQLPKRISDMLLGTLHLDIHAAAGDVVSASLDLIREHRTATLAERLQALEEAAQKNGRGALGVEPMVGAVNQRRLGELFLTDSASVTGWQCTQCRTLGAAIPLGCPACGGAIRSADLVEEFIAAAESEGARVHFVPAASLLDRYEGVGALLRF
jgi:peptide chain release factor subunit 1